MLINPFTLLNLGTSLTAGTDATSSTQGLLGGSTEGVNNSFGSLLNNNSTGLTLISTEPLAVNANAALLAPSTTVIDPNAALQNTTGQNLPLTTTTGSKSPIKAETLNYIEQILSGKAVLDGQNLTSTNSANLNANTTVKNINTDSLTAEQTELLSKIQSFLDSNSDAISQASPEEIQGLMDTITQLVAAAQANNSPVIPQAGSAAATQKTNGSETVIEVAKNFPEKSDPRILGKDNLQVAVKAADTKVVETATNLLDNNKSLFDDKISSTKALAADYDFTGSRITGFDNSNRNLLDGKLAILNGTAVKTSTVEAGSYGFAKISKGTNKVEITLEPASLGKIDIKFDFTQDGKTNLIVSADRKETLDLLQRDAKYFEKILSDRGIKTDSGSLSFNMRNHGGGAEGFAGQQQQRGFLNNFNFAVPIVDEFGNSINDNNYSRLSAYNNISSVSGLNILV